MAGIGRVPNADRHRLWRGVLTGHQSAREFGFLTPLPTGPVLPLGSPHPSQRHVMFVQVIGFAGHSVKAGNTRCAFGSSESLDESSSCAVRGGRNARTRKNPRGQAEW